MQLSSVAGERARRGPRARCPPEARKLVAQTEPLQSSPMWATAIGRQPSFSWQMTVDHNRGGAAINSRHRAVSPCGGDEQEPEQGGSASRRSRHPAVPRVRRQRQAPHTANVRWRGRHAPGGLAGRSAWVIGWILLCRQLGFHAATSSRSGSLPPERVGAGRCPAGRRSSAAAAADV